MTLGARRAVLLLIAVATLLRLVLAGITDLGLDEAYALAVSRQFQLSWFDHPPLVFWIAGAMQAAFGLGVPDLVLRLPFIAMSALTTWLLYRVTELHFGGRAALWAAFLFTVAPFFFLSTGSWVVPDGPLVLALMLASLGLSRIVLDDRADDYWRDWLLAGGALGLALLSKYHAAVFALGAVIYFVLHPRLRSWLVLPQPYVAVAIAALMFAPVIVWNAQNDWASLAFQLGRGTAVGHASAAIILRLFLTEAAYLLPTTAVLLLAAIVWSIVRRPEPRRSVWFFLALAVPIIVVLDANRFWTWQAYPHWAMPGWMLLLPLAGAMLVAARERWPAAGPAVAIASLLQFAVVTGAVVLLLSDVRVRLSAIDSFRVEAGTWSGVAAAVADADALKGTGFILTRRWSDAARVAEALRAPLPTLVFDQDGRGFDWTAEVSRLIGSDALIVLRADEADRMLARYAGYFESVEPVGTFAIEPGNPTLVHIARGRNLLEAWPSTYTR